MLIPGPIAAPWLVSRLLSAAGASAWRRVDVVAGKTLVGIAAALMEGFFGRAAGN